MVTRIYQSNSCGPFKIIGDAGKVKGRNFVTVQFLNTGSIVNANRQSVLDGRVADPLSSGINYDFNINRYNDYDKHIEKCLKIMYKHMMDRCYNPRVERYKSYGAIGVRVCDEWVSDQNQFLHDIKLVDGFDKYYARPFLYELDKDYKQLNIPKPLRVYSKDTCTFLYYIDNINLKAMDNIRDGMYFGVEITPSGKYHSRIRINKVRIELGTYTDQIAAANAYNHAQLYYHEYELIPLLNDVPYMSPEEISKYAVTK